MAHHATGMRRTLLQEDRLDLAFVRIKIERLRRGEGGSHQHSGRNRGQDHQLGEVHKLKLLLQQIIITHLVPSLLCKPFPLAYTENLGQVKTGNPSGEHRMSAVLSGAEFKKQLREGTPKLGIFVNSHSPTVAEQLAHSGYDWLLVDTQHGPMSYETLSAMLAGVASGGAKSLVRVGGYADRPGIQQALDMGADGVLVPYINTADEARQAVSCTRYPTTGTRSVYFPQRSMNKAGLLGYAGNANANIITALQVETADCIKNMDEIAAIPGVDMLFLGQNDLCMSMGLFEKYEFPHMYTSPELGAATDKLIAAAKKNNVILGIFLFGTSRVGEFLDKGFSLIGVGNDLHHVLTQTGAYVNDVEKVSKEKGKPWARRATALF
ncbi:MAG: hypothetical protein EXQ47_02685 [Bryobacterales bacterium]|nr:hypothetical protein [Bryobacterales bacterium]